MRPGESCRTCLFVVVKIHLVQNRQWWACHRYAPRPLERSATNADWPIVRIDSGPGLPADWCGEYVPGVAPEPAF